MRTVIDVDDAALEGAAAVLGTRTKVATVNAALALVAGRTQRVALLDVLDATASDLGDAEVMRGAWR